MVACVHKITFLKFNCGFHYLDDVCYRCRLSAEQNEQQKKKDKRRGKKRGNTKARKDDSDVKTGEKTQLLILTRQHALIFP